MRIDLTDEETESLARVLRNAIDADRYPLSPRVQMWRTILAQIQPEPPRAPLPPVKVYAPPRGGRRRR